MRILHVISQLGQGGAEAQLYRSIRGTLGSCEHRVVALAPGGVYAERLGALGIAVSDLPRRGRAEVGRLLRVAREMRRFRPAVVHGHLFSGNLYAHAGRRIAFPWGRRPPLVTTRLTSRPRRAWPGDLLERMAFRASKIVVVNATALREEVESAYDLPPGRVRVLPNVLDPAEFRVEEPREAIRSELGLGDGDVAVGHIASFSPEKRHDLVLDAFARAVARDPRLRLVLVGGGPREAGLRRRAQALGLQDRMHWLGWRDDVPRLLAAMDLTVNASDREGSPNAVLESLCQGVPVVATSVGGTPEALDGGRCGVLVPPGNAEQLARGILSLAANAWRRKEMGQAGHRHIRHRHAPEKVFTTLLSIYREVALCERSMSP